MNLSLIRKQSLPEEVLGAEEALETTPQPLCESHNAFGSSLLPAPGVAPVSELFPNSKTSSIPRSQEELKSNPAIHPLTCRLACFP